MPEEEVLLTTSKQYYRELNLTLINWVNPIIVLLTSFYSLLLLVNKKLKNKFRRTLQSLLLFLICNALICGFLSDVIHRYQSRVIWILPFFGVLLFFKWKEDKENHS